MIGGKDGMNMPFRIKKGTYALIAFAAAIALATPIGGREAPSVTRLPSQNIDVPDDDELLPDSNGATLLLRDHSRRADNTDWLKFETDPCGFLERVESRRSIFRQSALADGMDDFDDSDPADEARTMFGRWLSAHAEIAVITDAIDKTCDVDVPNDSDDDLAPDIFASWPRRTLHRTSERTWTSRADSFHVA